MTSIFDFFCGEQGRSRAIIGFFDLASRKHADKNVLPITIPYKMFLELEEWEELRLR